MEACVLIFVNIDYNYDLFLLQTTNLIFVAGIYLAGAGPCTSGASGPFVFFDIQNFQKTMYLGA